ncbi:hypothetical protein MMIC_P2235 [Mariprofundus micogutta]|uniref:Secreted protein n=1 Tax=Mariprofundus micogutta TaxID=1921010 RepID=A0A1L8CQT3_9PROT|nr:hypothetical protein [Mariprofundus micogutta]GAV21253.1 hypothetical protein MMIC_P2235 [Mariprofundus micogutta]
MKKIFVLSMFFALFLAAGFGLQNGEVALNIPVASADGTHDEDDSSSDDVSYTCVCPPGITACVCADGSDGQASTEAPTAAGPLRQRSF